MTTPEKSTSEKSTSEKSTVENGPYAAFARRIIRAYSRRVGAGDVEALAELLDLAHTLDESIHAAVGGLRQFGYSWAEIAARIGVTRQAAHQRWSNTTEGQPE